MNFKIIKYCAADNFHPKYYINYEYNLIVVNMNIR